MKIIFPWLDPCLMPNRQKGGWRKKANARKNQRADSKIITKSKLATFDFKPRTATLAISVMFHPPTEHRRDLDNCLAAIKGMIDGIADAIGIDDTNFRPITIDFGEVVTGGRIIIEICEKRG